MVAKMITVLSRALIIIQDVGNNLFKGACRWLLFRRSQTQSVTSILICVFALYMYACFYFHISSTNYLVLDPERHLTLLYNRDRYSSVTQVNEKTMSQKYLITYQLEHRTDIPTENVGSLKVFIKMKQKHVYNYNLMMFLIKRSGTNFNCLSFAHQKSSCC